MRSATTTRKPRGWMPPKTYSTKPVKKKRERGHEPIQREKREKNEHQKQTKKKEKKGGKKGKGAGD